MSDAIAADRTDARELSCIGLTNVDEDTLTFHGEPVDHYYEEMARRGDDVWSCSVIGCYGDDQHHGDPLYNTRKIRKITETEHHTP